MYEENLPFIINTLSKIINTQIIYLTNSQNMKKYLNINTKELELIKNKKLKIHLTCISEDSIIIIQTGLERIKKHIPFENIDHVIIDALDTDVIYLKLKELIENKDNPKIKPELFLLIENGQKLIQILKCYYTIYYTQNYGTVNELNLSIKSNLLNLNQKILNKIYKTENNNEENFIRKTPPDAVYRQINNYLFYIKEGFELKDINIFFYFNTKEENNIHMSSRLLIEVGKEYPIENLSPNSDLHDFALSSYFKFIKYMNNNFGLKNYWIVANTNYIKKFNFSKDNALWEGWRIECRTRIKEEIGLNLIFIFLRRKYIPPLYETYQDFNFILLEEYLINESPEISSKAVGLIELAADSLTPIEYYSTTKDSIRAIQTKLESFLIHNHSYSFFYNQLKIVPKEAYKVGLTFTFKVIISISEYVKDRIKSIKDRFAERLVNLYKEFSDDKFNLQTFEKLIKNTEWSDLLIDNTNYYKTYFSKCDERSLKLWEQKRNDFLVFCLNGGLIYKLLSIKDVFNWVRKVPELKILKSVLNKLVNMRIITNKNELIEADINCVVNNLHNIKQFMFNQDMLCAVIETDYLKVLQEVDSDNVYSEFLKYLLDNHLTCKLVNSIYFYLKKINKNETIEEEEKNKSSGLNIENNSSEKKSLNCLLPTLFKIYSNSQLSPSVLILSCKCLNILTYFDKFNKLNLITENCLTVISDYLSHPDEKLIYCSGELLSNIIIEARECIQEILEKNPKIFSKCLKILKGLKIPGSYYSSKTIILVIRVITILIEMPNAMVKENLTNEKNRKFVKYIFNYLQDNQATLPREMEQNMQIQEKVYELMELLTRKNTDLRRYIEENFKLLKLIDFKCEKIICIIENMLGLSQVKDNNAYGHSDNYLKMILSMLNFLKSFISNDVQIVKTIRLNCPSFINLILIVYENKKKEVIKIIVNECVDLFNILFEVDLKKEKYEKI